MKVLAKLTILVVGFVVCLPAYGEILIYNSSEGGYEFARTQGVWDVVSGIEKGYLILDVEYNEDGTISVTDAQLIIYWKDKNGAKRFEQDSWDLEHSEIERVEYKGKVQWLFWEQYANEKLFFLMLAGNASRKDIGKQEKREVATVLKGHNLSKREDDAEGELSYHMHNSKLVLHTSWTKYANKVEGLDGDYNAAVAFIKDYLKGKGYQEEP